MLGEDNYASTTATWRSDTPGPLRTYKGKSVSYTDTTPSPRVLSSRVELVDEDGEEMKQDIGLSEANGDEVEFRVDVDDAWGYLLRLHRDSILISFGLFLLFVRLHRLVFLLVTVLFLLYQLQNNKLWNSCGMTMLLF